MDIQEIISKFGNVAYAICIFFGGRFGLQFFTFFKQTKYNFLVFATVFAGIFIGGEVAVGTFKTADFWRYAVTYAVVTSCYEMVCQWFPFLRPKTTEVIKENNKP